jgi:hypothetical protein
MADAFPVRCLLLSCTASCLLGVCGVPASAHPGQRQIGLEHARHELARCAYFSCPTTECRHRTYACHRRSPLRIQCRSETLQNREEEPQSGKRIVL